MLLVPTSDLIRRLLIVALVVLTSVAATTSPSALFTASAPGMPLTPVGDSAGLIELTQGQRSLVWVSKKGDVDTVTVQGWPSSDGINEISGAMLVHTVFHNTGTVGFGEPPMTVEFILSG